MKPTSFEIPQGCTRVTIEQHEDKVLTIFETPIKESFIDNVVSVSANCLYFEFKEDEPEARFNDGDVIKIIRPDGDCLIAIKKGDEKLSSGNNEAYVIIGFTGKLAIDKMANFGYRKEMGRKVLLSTESLPIIQDALAKVGKKWNSEKKCIEDLKPEKWRAEYGGKYWYVDKYFKAADHTERFDEIDNSLYEIGNYFQTEQQSKDFAERIKQLPR